eukprot:Tbor_TRINITY_DN5718_c3_g1::TRINITY_DN5718_c3_g1_i2::g.19547::m.19547
MTQIMDRCVNTLITDKENGKAWNKLGLFLTSDTSATVDGATYGRRECFARALECGCLTSSAWIGLGSSLKSDDKFLLSGKEYSKLDCYVNALQCDSNDNEKNSSLWRNLGNFLQSDEVVLLSGKEYGKLDCYVKAIECISERNDNNAWYFLSCNLKPGEVVSVGGINYDKEQCRSKS